LLGQLEQTQNRLEEIERQTVDLQKMITTTEEKVKQIIEDLGKEPEPEPVPVPPTITPETTPPTGTAPVDEKSNGEASHGDTGTAETST
jgi:hypothetical protein